MTYEPPRRKFGDGDLGPGCRNFVRRLTKQLARQNIVEDRPQPTSQVFGKQMDLQTRKGHCICMHSVKGSTNRIPCSHQFEQKQSERNPLNNSPSFNFFPCNTSSQPKYCTVIFDYKQVKYFLTKLSKQDDRSN